MLILIWFQLPTIILLLYKNFNISKAKNPFILHGFKYILLFL